MPAIRAAGKPAVGHNCLFDLVYVLTQFVDHNETWPEFQAAMGKWFPGGLYDTKHLAKVRC
jgi:poly(A)-specific ribonuclease